MTTQEDICKRKHGGNAESDEAHRSRKPKASSQKAWALKAIVTAKRKGLTVDELAEIWGVGLNAISGRFSELHKEGLIERLEDSQGGRVRRDTRSGGKAAVWISTRKGDRR
jgi:Fic family protein